METAVGLHNLDPAQIALEKAAAEIHAYIAENDAFHSEIDRDIAHFVTDRISNDPRLSAQEKFPALDALYVLIPTRNDTGQRIIDGTKIAAPMEKWIASRLLSPEIDIAGQDGSWGKLPDVVKRQILGSSDHMALEMTSNCTVACPFCAYADKGPILAKASFESIVEVLKFFDENQASSLTYPRRDVFYWGTDPFDIKWAARDGIPERDYRDIAKAHAENTKHNRNLDTSTAVPLGEEMRVLQFAIDLLDSKQPISMDVQRSLRISITDANARRANHILAILRALHPGAPNLLVNDTRNHIALRGNKLNQPIDLQSWDVIGPACRDGVIVGVKSVDGMIMQGASNERPNGEVRFPIESASNGRRRFDIPRMQRAPEFTGYEDFREMFPPALVDVFIFGSDVEYFSTQEHTYDPHRALLRLAAVMRHLDRKYGSQLPRAEAFQVVIERELAPAVQQLRAHLASNPDNWVMRAMLDSYIHPMTSKKIGEYAIEA